MSKMSPNGMNAACSVFSSTSSASPPATHHLLKLSHNKSEKCVSGQALITFRIHPIQLHCSISNYQLWYKYWKYHSYTWFSKHINDIFSTNLISDPDNHEHLYKNITTWCFKVFFSWFKLSAILPEIKP